MIDFVINGKPADLPTDFQMKMIYENPYFTKSGSFSLDCDLPLKGSQRNAAIFGHIERFDATKEKISYSAYARANGRMIFTGIATVMKVSSDKVTVQLLGGNSVMNFYSEDVYVDELDLGKIYGGGFAANSGVGFWYMHSNEFKYAFGSIDETECVFFPCVTGDPANWSEKYYLPPTDIHYLLDGIIDVEVPYRCAVQPYLMIAIKRIINTVGYDITRNDIENTWLRNIYICNNVSKRAIGWINSGGKPEGYMADAMPHWSLNKFITELENFLGVVFYVNDSLKTVEIISKDEFYRESDKYTYINDDQILDEYEMDLDNDNSSSSVMSGNVGYKLDYSDPYLKVDKSVLKNCEKKYCTDFADVTAKFNALTDKEKNMIILVNNSDNRLYIPKKDDKNVYSLAEINVFGDLYRTSDDSVDIELNIIPANTKLYEIGLFSYGGEWNGGSPKASITYNLPFTTSESNKSTDTIQQIVENSGSIQDKKTNDTLMVAISTGESYTLCKYQNIEQKFPMPFTDNKIPCSGQTSFPDMSLSLHDVCEKSIGHRFSKVPTFDTKNPYKVKIVSPQPFDPRSVFLIRNQKFVCQKLEADYNLKDNYFIFEGTFFRIT